MLWFAWKYLSLWYQQQLTCFTNWIRWCCDLLENIYLCGINNNTIGGLFAVDVVICLKISIFVVSTTTNGGGKGDAQSCDLLKNIYLCGINNNGAVLQTRRRWSCDLLKNIYLCGINNNSSLFYICLYFVVICLKISTFVVSTTTSKGCIHPRYTLWFAWKYLPLWYQQQLFSHRQHEVLGCDLLENIYLCGINNNCILINR